MDIPELVPLEGGDVLRRDKPRPYLPVRQVSLRTGRSCSKGPLKALRLVLLITVVPALFIFIPVYLRYRVFSGQMYPVGMTDMRMIDNKISTTWCQRQVVQSNTTFNAFLMSEQPHISADLVPVSMTRYLTLEDDMKEYWGFYLLEGSVVTVSTCVRWPGASLIMIRGHKHLQDCAYIGDDSSEEIDELIEASQHGLINNETLLQKIKTLFRDSPANVPDKMVVHKEGVRFHDHAHDNHQANVVVHHDPYLVKTPDVTDHEPQELKQILERLYSQRHIKKKNDKDKKPVQYQIPPHLMSIPALHRYRDTNIDREERKWFSFNDLDGGSNLTSEEIFIPTNRRINKTEIKIKELEKKKGNFSTEKLVIKEDAEEKVQADQKEPNGPTSAEVYDGIISQLKSLGDKGKRVLQRLSDDSKVAVNLEITTRSQNESDSDEALAEEKLEYLKDVLEEAIDEENRRVELKDKRRKANEEARTKRELYIQQAEFAKSLNKDDEEKNSAIEEEDGLADVHRVVNETTANDMSNSELWSSFSSSEEALLECEGLILNLPLTPHPACSRNNSEVQHERASKPNAVTYRVPANGYYFFVFNSENEVQENFIRVKFDLQKTTYDVRRTLLECRNFTDKCDIPLRFLSTEKVVLEVPLRDNDSLWNEEFVVMSECVPRTSVYLVCAIAVPLLVVLFAFQ